MALTADEQRLVVSLEARMTKYEKDMERAARATNDNFRKMEGRANRFQKDMERATGKAAASMSDRLSAAFTPFLRGGAIFAGVAGAALALKEVAGSVADVEREARKAGVSAKTWMQWSYVATATGASIDGVTDALKELNIRGDEFAKTGKGGGAEWFTRLGYSAEEVARKLQDPNRFLDEIIGKIQKLDRAAQTRALDELFGGTGAEELAKVLGLSVEEIQKLRSEAATFTDEQIEAAKKIDREFSTLWRNVTVYAKEAAIEGVGYAKQIADAISWLTGDSYIDKLRERVLAPEARIERLQARRKELAEKIAAVEAEPAGSKAEQQQRMGYLKSLRDALADLDDQLFELTGGSDEYKRAMVELSAITVRAGGSFDGTAISAGNFKDALADLKKLVPELKAELDTLADTDAIDAAYRKAVGSATTMGQILNATDIANRAKSIARFGRHDDILSLIRTVESSGNYNATLDNGRWTGGAVNLTSMTLDQILALGDSMRTPANRALYGNGAGSSALGAYQITGRTLRSLMDELDLTGDRLFDEDTQDELARALLRRRGNDPAALRNEWTGLNRVDDATIRNTYANTPTAAQPLAPTDAQQRQSEAQQRQTELLKQQAEARKRLNETIDAGLDRARFEQSISGMSAQQQRVEIELYRYQQEAKRITLTDTEIQKLREKLTLTAQLDAQNRQTTQSQQTLAQAGEFFGQSFTNALSGLLTGTQDVNSAVRSLINSLIDASLQAMLLGQGPLAGLFGGMGGGLFGAIFGFSEGGYTGAGGTYEPAGIVHRGEYVVSKKATDRLGVENLEALHRGALKGFAAGGYVGSAPAVHRLHMPANGNVVQPIQINAPITVNGSAGTEQQNADLAKRMAKQMEATVRGTVADELRRQARPGNTLSRMGR